MVQGLYDGPGRQKQQCFEKSMNHEVKNSGRPGTKAECQEHIADLADRRISKNPFNVDLG